MRNETVEVPPGGIGAALAGTHLEKVIQKLQNFILHTYKSIGAKNLTPIYHEMAASPRDSRVIHRDGSLK